MLSYQTLIKYLRDQHDYPVSIKKYYCVIMVPGIDYHITIYEDQWDRYEEISNKPYYLFHVSSNNENNRCSSYFWVNKYNHIIKKIPRNFFMYNQPKYSFFSSTRNPCHLRDISILLKTFQRILNKI